MEFAKFLKTSILEEICERLLLKQIGTYDLVFVTEFTVSFANSFFATIDTAITRTVVQWCSAKKGSLTSFTKITRKHLR